MKNLPMINNRHLSETMIMDRNRENQKLNSMGLVQGIPNPITHHSITSDKKKPKFETFIGREILITEKKPTKTVSESLSGINIRQEPHAHKHIGQE